MSIGLVAQWENDRAASLASSIKSALRADDVDVAVDRSTAAALDIPGEPVEHMDSCDLVVSIGGDGTFLFAARSIGSTPLVGVNLGEVGFLTTIAPEDAADLIPQIYAEVVDGTHDLQRLPRVAASFADRELGPALNEIIVHAPQRGPSGRMRATISIDGDEYVTDAVDGVMVATPTGSTAYNLSEDGPLLMPAVSGMIVNSMCGDNPMPPLVVPLDATIRVTMRDASFAYVIADGRSRHRLDVPGHVEIGTTTTPIHVAGPQVGFFQGLEKLE